MYCRTGIRDGDCMALVPGDSVVSYQNRLYAETETVLDRRDLPEVHTSRIAWPQPGLLLSAREYPPAEPLGHRLGVCIAPSGSACMVSWRLLRTLPTDREAVGRYRVKVRNASPRSRVWPRPWRRPSRVHSRGLVPSAPPHMRPPSPWNSQRRTHINRRAVDRPGTALIIHCTRHGLPGTTMVTWVESKPSRSPPESAAQSAVRDRRRSESTADAE